MRMRNNFTTPHELFTTMTRRSIARIVTLLLLVGLPVTTSFVAPSGSSKLHTVPVRSPAFHTTSTAAKTPLTPLSLFGFGGLELSHVIYDSTSTAFDAWEWTNAIGAPAALVAGAVLVTLSESREDTAPRKSDSNKTRILKLSMRFLLLSSFALEVVSIFVATMTGGVLLGHGEQTVAKKLIGYGSPLQLLHYHHE